MLEMRVVMRMSPRRLSVVRSLLLLLTMVGLAPRPWKRRMFHVPKGISYAVENSKWGTWLAHKLGFHWIDKDFHVTKDGVAVFGHWGMIRKNGMLLPRWFIRKYGRNAKISDVYWDDLQKLHTGRIRFRGRRRYRFMTVSMGFIQAAQLDMGIGMEYKGDQPARTVIFWLHIDRTRVDAGMSHDKLVAMSLPDMRGAGEMFASADQAGVLTMVIRANEGVPRSWEQHLDFHRGKVRWTNG